MSQIGKNIEIYMMDGEPQGRWQVNLLNWNCIAYKINRNDMKDSFDLEGVKAPGVYFLFGRDDTTGKQFVYIGEGDNVIKRIMQSHSFEKDESYWTEAVIFVTPDGTLDKAKIKYLENRFHSIAVEADRYIVKNSNTPTQSPLQNKIRDMLEEFIINAKLVMLPLGHKVFEPQPSQDVNGSDKELLFLSRNHGKSGKAIGKISDDGFWVLKGSYINPHIASYLPEGLKKLRKEYAPEIDKKGILQKDICFGSPSYASSFVFGRNSNGLTEWKNSDGKSLKEINGMSEENNQKKDKTKSVKNSQTIIDSSSADELHLAGKFEAYAYVLQDSFVVKKGSQLSDSESNSCSQAIRNYRKRLIDDGVVKDGVFVHDYRFKSPSTAAACILGRNENGKRVWKNKEGKSLKELQESEEMS